MANDFVTFGLLEQHQSDLIIVIILFVQNQNMVILNYSCLQVIYDSDSNHYDKMMLVQLFLMCVMILILNKQVDKIPGGARLGFITIGDGKTEVLVHIDCLVFPPTENSAPIFRAIRNGPLKDKAPPGEPRIMRSLLQALQKSVEIARL